MKNILCTYFFLTKSSVVTYDSCTRKSSVGLSVSSLESVIKVFKHRVGYIPTNHGCRINNMSPFGFPSSNASHTRSSLCIGE